jgi:hypothetical protein
MQAQPFIREPTIQQRLSLISFRKLGTRFISSRTL